MNDSSTRLPRALYAIAGGRAVSFLGDEVATLAIAFRAKDHYGHLGVAAILIANALPLVLLSAHAGFLVDRFRTKPVLIITTLLQAAVCFALAVSPAAFLIPLVVLLACGTAVATPAWQALIPSIVPAEKLASAFGTLQSTITLFGLAGPALGGWLVGRFGFSWPLVFDGASFVVLVAVAALMRADRTPSGAGTERQRGQVTAGFRVVWSDAVLRSLLILIVVFIVVLGAINVAEIFFITTALHAGPTGYGFLGLCFGVGSVITSALAGRLTERWASSRLFVVGCFLVAGALLGFSLSRELALAAAFSVLVGIGNSLLNVSAMVIVSARVADEVRGRVFSAVQGLASSGQVISIVLGGLLLIVVAPGTVLLGSSVAALIVLLLTVGPVLRGESRSEVAAS